MTAFDMTNNFTENIQKIISTLRGLDDKEFPFNDECLKAAEKASHKFDREYEIAANDLEYIFSGNNNSKYQISKTIELIERWNSEKNQKYSIVALMAAAIDGFDFNEKNDSQNSTSVLMAGILASIPNILDYHNNLHFKKVILHTVRLISIHNGLFSNVKTYFDKSRITNLLIAAAIHDFKHRGRGNVTNKKYQMAKTEIESFELAAPYLRLIDTDESDLADIKVMLITTDVSPFGDPVSPSNQLRRAYEYHYGYDDDDDPETLNLSSELLVLADKSVLCLLCMILHEADIMNSAAVSYETTILESIAISQEIGREAALPQDTLVFLQDICDQRMVTDAAQYLGSKNLDDIIERVRQDFDNGNKSYMLSKSA